MPKIDIKEPKKVILVGSLCVILLVLIAIFFSGGSEERIRRLENDKLAHPAPAPEEPPERRMVTLFFLANGDDLLHGEEREIMAGRSVAEEAEQVLDELIRGSEGDLISPLPPEASVRQVFITAEGVAFVDFSREIMEKSSYGSSSELSAVFAVVNSLAYNFKSIKRVRILVEGGERETLGGHIDLSKPFVPNFSLLVK
jgi:spore germination protein GerM